MAAKKDKMIPSEKERKRALKYATPAGTGRMWVTMGIAFIIFGIILLLIPIGLVILEASAQRYDPESIHTATLVFYLLGAFFGFCGCFCIWYLVLPVVVLALYIKYWHWYTANLGWSLTHPSYIVLGFILSAALCFEIVYIDIKFGEK